LIITFIFIIGFWYNWKKVIVVIINNNFNKIYHYIIWTITFSQKYVSGEATDSPFPADPLITVAIICVTVIVVLLIAYIIFRKVRSNKTQRPDIDVV